MEGKKKARKVRGSKKPGKDEIYKTLKNKINITKEEFDQSYKEFQELCPSGEMSKDQFLEKSGELLGAGNISDSLFRVFDEDGRFEKYLYFSVLSSSFSEVVSWISESISWPSTAPTSPSLRLN